jgi:hypothetical protein
MADDAVTLDGDPQTARARELVRGCDRKDRNICLQGVKDLEGHLPVGAHAGLAGYLTQPVAAYVYSHRQGAGLPMDLSPILAVEPNLDVAEKAAHQAMDEAQHVADARAEKQKKIDAEAADIDAATKACAASEGTCKSRCDKGEATYCLVWALRLRDAKSPRLSDARAACQKACDAGLQSACNTIADIEQRIQSATAQVENLWSSVVEVGDDLTQKVFAAEKLAKLANRPHLARALEQLRAVNHATVVERYCPARKAFLQAATAADFQRRAAAHCRDEAPSGQGLSGAVVSLTPQCTSVYATSCP